MSEELKFRLTEKDIKINDLEDFQNTFKINLPKDFINHYLKYNGGWPNANRSAGLEFEYSFEHFFSIKFGEDTIENRIRDLALQGYDSPPKIPFAINDLDNIFFLFTNDENYGQIFVSDNGCDEWDYHSKSFTDFLKGLKKNNFYGKFFDDKILEWVKDPDFFNF